nr:MAG TPA: hypothetical protein [Caudoviricetes sp.]
MHFYFNIFILSNKCSLKVNCQMFFKDNCFCFL